MRSRALPILLSAVTLAAIGARAQQPATVVVVVDNDRVFEESNPGKAASERIQTEYAGWQERIGAAQQEIEDLTTRRDQQAATLTPAERAQLDLEIEEKGVELQRLRDDANRQFNEIRNQILLELEEQQLAPAVAAMAQENGYTIVLNTQTPGLVHYDGAVDVTDELVARLNAGAGADSVDR